jgi:CRISPR-associated protein Cmr4
LFIYTESPLHAGTGAGLGPVDLPIQRERSTDYPIVQASGVKGALRSEAGGSAAEIDAVFGPEGAEHAGAFSSGDARVLLFPVRSLKGVFAWVTSIDVLARFLRDAATAGLSVPLDLPDPPDKDHAHVSGQGVVLDGSVVLEEFAFKATETEEARRIADWLATNALPEGDEYAYWRNKLPGALVILPDDAFRDFVRHATEVTTRIRLTEQKTVAPGALWTEEHLPTDALLYAPAHASRLRMNGDKPPALAEEDPDREAEKVLGWISSQDHIPHRLQLGGNETIGRGLVRLRWYGGAS